MWKMNAAYGVKEGFVVLFWSLYSKSIKDFEIGDKLLSVGSASDKKKHYAGRMKFLRKLQP
jgi:hypothetical protein